MSPLLLIKPAIWLLDIIVTIFVALFSAITGNYYAAIPRDGGQAGVVAYVPPSEPGDSATLSIQLAGGVVFRADFSSISPLADRQRQLLGPLEHDGTAALAMLTTGSGDTMRCEFALERTRLTASGVCRDNFGRIFDIRS